MTSNHPAEALETAVQQLFATSLATDSEPGKNERVARALGSLGWTSILARDVPRAVWAGSRRSPSQIYLEGLSGDSQAAGEWRQMIRKDFKDLSERQLQNLLMAEIDREIGP